MDWRAKCAVVIPCLNEEQTVAALVGGARHHASTVYVVDDGSKDRTAELAARAGAKIISHAQNLGKGAALRTGWGAAAESAFEWVLTMDGDGQHSPADIPAFFDCAQRTAAAIVVGNRMHERQQMPWVRRFANGWMSRRLSAAAGQALPDSQCGFRLINLPILNALSLTTQHFEIESEVLLAFARHRHRIEFVPIQGLYKDEQSKIHPVRDTWRWLCWWRGTRRAREQVETTRAG